MPTGQAERAVPLCYTPFMAPSYDKKTVVVIGGAGSVGSFLCEALARKFQVVCVDNFATGTPANIQALLQQPNFELIRHDINEPLDLESHRELDRFHIRVHGVQEVYHLASPSATGPFRLATMQTNSTGLNHVLDLTARYKAKFLFVSTSDLYEPTDDAYISEDARCWNDHLLPDAPFIESKRFAETLVETYADIHHFPAKIVRAFRSYGPRMKVGDGLLIPEIVQAALKQQDLEIPYSEDARLSLCYVSDLVDGLMKAMDHSLDFRVINLGSDQETYLGLVVEQILKLTGSTARIRFRAQGDSRVSLVPNIHKARQLLQWLPLVRLDEGLKHLVEYARSKQHEVTFDT